MIWCKLKFYKKAVGIQFSHDRWDGYTIWQSQGSFKLKNYLITYAIHNPDYYEPTPPILLSVDNDILYIDDTIKVSDIEFIITRHFVISITRLY
jgi:hypothetical protein